MNYKYLVAGLVVAVLVIGVAVVKFSNPQLAGDFPGGIVPNQTLTCSAGTNSCTPILNNLYVNGGISAGGVAANNQITAVYTAVATYPSVAGSLPGASSTITAATSTSVAFSASGFSVGDPCEVEYNFTTSSLLSSANVTAVTGSAVTTTVNILNTTGVAAATAVTSTITGVSSTVKVTCFHTGV